MPPSHLQILGSSRSVGDIFSIEKTGVPADHCLPAFRVELETDDGRVIRKYVQVGTFTPATGKLNTENEANQEQQYSNMDLKSLSTVILAQSATPEDLEGMPDNHITNNLARYFRNVLQDRLIQSDGLGVFEPELTIESSNITAKWEDLPLGTVIKDDTLGDKRDGNNGYFYTQHDAGVDGGIQASPIYPDGRLRRPAGNDLSGKRGTTSAQPRKLENGSDVLIVKAPEVSQHIIQVEKNKKNLSLGADPLMYSAANMQEALDFIEGTIIPALENGNPKELKQVEQLRKDVVTGKEFLANL